MIYIDRFVLPVDEEENIIGEAMARNGGPYGYIDNVYPCRVFPDKQLKEIWFRPVTVFYGGNGSGKSTLLNLIAEKAGMKRIAPRNSGETFDLYADRCRMTLAEDDDGCRRAIPEESRIITSDDVFDYMLTLRTGNDDITEDKAKARDAWAELKYGRNIRFTGMDDYEAFRLQVMSRKRSVSRRDFIRQTAGSETALHSNGETALRYFEERLTNDTLYCLDEPENSMSPKLQLELVKVITEMSRYCGCQFIIATHSPFLLAMDGARVIDLDSRPAQCRNWWELENCRIFFDFFHKNRELFM